MPCVTALVIQNSNLLHPPLTCPVMETFPHPHMANRSVGARFIIVDLGPHNDILHKASQGGVDKAWECDMQLF